MSPKTISSNTLTTAGKKVIGRRTEAVCYDCDRSWETPNALAVAARHATAHRHTVAATITVDVVYSPQAIE